MTKRPPEDSINQTLIDELLERIRFQRLSDASLQIGNGVLLSGQEAPVPLTIDEVQEIAARFGRKGPGSRVTFAAEEMFVRSRVEPVQAMFSQWMAGSIAQVNGENIPFGEIITWCQDCHDMEARRKLAKEARSLCRFLAPMSHATWQALTAAVSEELGYPDYLSYCKARRSRPFKMEAELCGRILDVDRTTYMEQVEEWLEDAQADVSLSDATRFDAIYLLGMRYMDSGAESLISRDAALNFFSGLGLDENTGVHLHFEGRSGRQSYCVPVAIPGKVHVITGPVTGWLDWEALFHEMGHAFSFIHTSPDIPVEHREFLVSGAVSETFAFLFQRLCMQESFLDALTGSKSPALSRIEQIHQMKFKVLTRRYGAKFLIEFENFSKNRISRGQDLYASVMERETGFFYDPETYLFDLMPDFYSLDYFLAFEASSILMHWLEKKFDREWFMKQEALNELKAWAALGSQYDLHEFVSRVTGGEKLGKGGGQQETNSTLGPITS